MTTMDSDSESQDSDDGRRFRFEATRKDPVVPVDTTSGSKSLKSKHKSHESGSHYRDRKERSRHESGRRSSEKDRRHLIKHSKHESRSSRQENGGKNSHKDHRDTRDISVGSSINDKGSRNSSGDARERSRDAKRQFDRDRTTRTQRSREHSHDRAPSDKHGSRERHKHHSRDKSRDRSRQSSRIKSSSGDQYREDHHGKHDFSRKISVKENRSQNSRDHSSPKNVERARSYSETPSIENPASGNAKKDSSLDSQDCNELDLSQFDVLSETDENMSDSAGSRTRTLSPHHHKIKIKRHNFDDDQSAGYETKKARVQQEELRKVKAGNDNDSMLGSSNNNPSAVSDFLLDSASSMSVSVTRETRADTARGKFEHREEKKIVARNNCGLERSDSVERYLQHSAVISVDETRPSENERSGFAYGPLLPTKSASDDEEEISLKSKTVPTDDNVDNERVSFIGPRLPWIDKERGIETQQNDRDVEWSNSQSAEREDTGDSSTNDPPDVAFGPVLPPHLLQRQLDNSRDRIIGPVLSDAVQLCEENSGANSDDDPYAMGPLPEDHPALRNSRVHEQLDLRAQRIRNERYSEEIDGKKKREEWMTELPPVHAANLGLGPRKFRLRDGPDMSDRSCWTDTPAQKIQKQKDSEARRLNDTQEADKEHTKDSHRQETVHRSDKCEKSLLEIHQSKIAKRKKKEEKEAKLTGIPTRRPFDRDIDLQANRFNQAQKKTILMKAQLLDDRFSRGQI